MSFLSRKLHSLIKDFENAEKRGSLSYGIFDRDIRKFVLLVLEELIKNFDNDSDYFETVGVLEDFFNQMHYSLSGVGWMVWTAIDLNKLNEISSGSKEDINKITSIRDFYKGLKF